MIEVTVTATGKTLDDALLGLDEARRKIADGYTSGGDRNDDGNYRFDVSGEEEEDEKEQQPTRVRADSPIYPKE